MKRAQCILLAFTLFTQGCLAAEDLIASAHNASGEPIPYILNYKNLSPKYVVILFPGGHGMMNPHMEEGKLVYQFRGNFLIRSRKFLVDDEFVTVATNASHSRERIQAIIDDLNGRFPAAQIYLMGTSRGTFDTMSLADYLSDKIAGVIHTSSWQSIAAFNATKYANRHLVVHHRHDGCRSTPFSAALAGHERYGNELIAMEGGTAVGDPCEPFGYHGFNGIERETMDAIKAWIKQKQGTAQESVTR